ncbi:type II toxin-antitoxin system RelE/ParE family toxin [Formosa sp. Hel1_33_131]|jgi:plasmid stabilization system protein ParE|uniref:type II toxin-antitoxin system RelE/ParE family toxin n=1 Tax=Formosa sp. Hel1_33_131 TaxID=1336794 RepID=UPI00084E0B13|nr:type II toxin-antitoxin system RelE/ParE family toxin [Formosa sp. Hel1_33_131]
MGQVVWSKRSTINLKRIWNFYVKRLKTVSGANSVINGIKKTGDALSIDVLYQTEENLKSNQYRAVYKHFKIIYKIKDNRVLILQIFDSRQTPDKLKS